MPVDTTSHDRQNLTQTASGESGAVQGADPGIARLVALPGIGQWTASYIAMRALREPDALPAADVGLMRALVDDDGTRPNATEVAARAEA